ncbi:MAG TPA: hypothetical protein VE196_04945, partial [Pseudonocardiaceae bacterium]|nr:hypothetical protein [Pseudonocardiaceae bacterium]
SALEISRELCTRGHRVVWYSGAAFQARIEATGAQFEPMHRAYDFGGRSRVDAFPHHADLGPITSITVGLKEIFYDLAPDVLADLREIRSRFEPDVVVADDFSFGASFFCEQTGIPLVWVTNGMYLLGSRDTAPLGLARSPSTRPIGRLRNALLRVVTKRVVMRDLVRAADTTRRGVGLAPLSGGPFENIARPPDLYLLCTVSAFEYPRSDMFPQAHFVGAPLGSPREESDLPSWWHETEGRKPVVLVTQGTVGEDTKRLLVPTIQALADEDVLVVVTTGTSAAKSLIPRELPANVRVERVRAVLPLVAAAERDGDQRRLQRRQRRAGQRGPGGGRAGFGGEGRGRGAGPVDRRGTDGAATTDVRGRDPHGGPDVAAGPAVPPRRSVHPRPAAAARARRRRHRPYRAPGGCRSVGGLDDVTGRERESAGPRL